MSFLPSSVAQTVPAIWARWCRVKPDFSRGAAHSLSFMKDCKSAWQQNPALQTTGRSADAPLSWTSASHPGRSLAALHGSHVAIHYGSRFAQKIRRAELDVLCLGFDHRRVPRCGVVHVTRVICFFPISVSVAKRSPDHVTPVRTLAGRSSGRPLNSGPGSTRASILPNSTVMLPHSTKRSSPSGMSNAKPISAASRIRRAIRAPCAPRRRYAGSVLAMPNQPTSPFTNSAPPATGVSPSNAR